jgi:quinol-cytochrome oxidoreductase complex cytochrome b subunit
MEPTTTSASVAGTAASVRTHPEAPSYERFPLRPGKTYGLMTVVPIRTEATAVETERQVHAWPAALVREVLVFVVTLLALTALSVLFDAPLEEPANALHPPNPAKAPWYFLGLQEMVSYSAFWGGVGVPALLVLLAVAAPFLERRRGGEGVWFDRSRSAANWIFVAITFGLGLLTIIGTFFRGQNWAFTVPW